MRIDSLFVSNFRGIQCIDVTDLGDTIIIAGQNGSGKSCILDAIRLLKSTYGGYQHNEWQQFFGEFQINLNDGSRNFRSLFNDQSKPVTIAAKFQLREAEKEFVTQNLNQLLEETVWKSILPDAYNYGQFHTMRFTEQFRSRQPEINTKIQALLPELKRELSSRSIEATTKINQNGSIEIRDSPLLSLIFTNYRPRQIGIIDFHGAQRNYGRESVQGIQLNLEQVQKNYSQHILYNSNNKYNNVKSEMAGVFIKEILSEKAGKKQLGDDISLMETLTELFETFFPDKKFLGPQPTLNGNLSFPVLTQSGSQHDLDDLSSGEKEILYGYLRIRSSAPKNSIILLDEPELHLNPRLVRRLPEFYRKHLGEELDNQLWLITHSDALIREAVGRANFNVFHMSPSSTEAQEISQLRALSVLKDLDAAVADLVGDLASYRPGGRGLIFEGGGDSDFDRTLVSKLFFEELQGMNLISGSDKTKVRALHEVLHRAHLKGDLPTKFFAITDMDSGDQVENTPAVDRYEWDVYHIENYLLDAEIVCSVINNLNISGTRTPENILDHLREAARKVVPGVLAHKMRVYANEQFIRCLDWRFSPNSRTIGKDLHAAAVRSVNRINVVLNQKLSQDELVSIEENYRKDIEESFLNDSWKDKLPGREILRQLVRLEQVQVPYEVLRNLIMNKMAEVNYKPPGMENVIRKILAS